MWCTINLRGRNRARLLFYMYQNEHFRQTHKSRTLRIREVFLGSGGTLTQLYSEALIQIFRELTTDGIIFCSSRILQQPKSKPFFSKCSTLGPQGPHLAPLHRRRRPPSITRPPLSHSLLISGFLWMKNRVVWMMSSKVFLLFFPF